MVGPGAWKPGAQIDPDVSRAKKKPPTKVAVRRQPSRGSGSFAPTGSPCCTFTGIYSARSTSQSQRARVGRARDIAHSCRERAARSICRSKEARALRRTGRLAGSRPGLTAERAECVLLESNLVVPVRHAKSSVTGGLSSCMHAWAA